nr:hypothetical protein [Tanacetum cinerariifolium]
LQKQHSEMVSMFEAQGLEINSLKARIKLLEDKDRGVADQSGDDVLIKGRRLDEWEEAAKKVSENTEEMATVLTSMDVVTVLSSGVVEVPTGSGFIPTANPPATGEQVEVMVMIVKPLKWVCDGTQLVFLSLHPVEPAYNQKGEQSYPKN